MRKLNTAQKIILVIGLIALAIRCFTYEPHWDYNPYRGSFGGIERKFNYNVVFHCLGIIAVTAVMMLIAGFPGDLYKEIPEAIEGCKYIAQSFFCRRGDKFFRGLGYTGGKLMDALEATLKVHDDLSFPLQVRFWREVVPMSKNPITNNLMFTDIWHLAEQKMTIFDNNIRRARELTPGETTAYIRAKYINKPSSNLLKYTDAWDEVQKRTQAMRTILDDLHAEADTYAKQYAPGTILEYIQNYMPHSWEYERLTRDEFFKRYLEQFARNRNLFDANGDPDILEAKRIYERDIAPNSKFIAENLTMKRTADMPGYDMSPIAIMNYIDDAAKQMAEWKHLGENYNKIQDWLSGIEQDAGKIAREFAEELFHRTFQRCITRNFRRFAFEYREYYWRGNRTRIIRFLEEWYFEKCLDSPRSSFWEEWHYQCFEKWLGSPPRKLKGFRLTPLTSLRIIFRMFTKKRCW